MLAFFLTDLKSAQLIIDTQKSFGPLLSAYDTTLSSLLDKYAPIVTKLSRRQSPSNPWFSTTLRAFRFTLRHAENIWKRTFQVSPQPIPQAHPVFQKRASYLQPPTTPNVFGKQSYTKLLHCKSFSPLPTTSPGTSLADSFASFFHRQSIQTPSLSRHQPRHIISALTVSTCHS